MEEMGVIRKKIAARGGEGGVKYVCDVCSADITSTVCFPLSQLMGVALLVELVIAQASSVQCYCGPYLGVYAGTWY